MGDETATRVCGRCNRPLVARDRCEYTDRRAILVGERGLCTCPPAGAARSPAMSVCPPAVPAAASGVTVERPPDGSAPGGAG